jgi:ATP-dependent protease ClpP protease subunit
MTPRFPVKALAPNSVEILIHGVIGKSYWDEDAVSGKQFAETLNAIPEGTKITLSIDSDGGSVPDGIVIYNAIKRRAKDIVARIDGWAASIASLFPLAANEVVSSPGSQWFMHKPWTDVFGADEDALLERAAELKKSGEDMAALYAAETGKTPEECMETMKKRTWFSAQEAVTWGLADRVEGSSVAMASADIRGRMARLAEFYGMKGLTVDESRNDFTAVVPQEKPANKAEANQTKKEDMKALMALLATAGIVASAEANDEQAVASAKAWLDKQKADTDAVKASLETERKEHAETRKAFAEAAVDRAVSEGKIEDKPETRAAWAKAHIADRATAGVQMASIKAAPAAQMGHTMGQGSGQNKPKELFGLERTIAAMAAGRRN